MFVGQGGWRGREKSEGQGEGEGEEQQVEMTSLPTGKT